MTNLLLNHATLDRETRDYNSSAILALFRFVKRQPWKLLAAGTWNAAKHFLQLTLVAASLGSLFSPLAHAAAYKAVDAEIPFEFTIGQMSFPAGHYQLVYASPGLLSLKDDRFNVVASFFTLSVVNNGDVPTSKLVFNVQDEHHRLNQIWIEDSRILEVLGNPVASHRSKSPKEQPVDVGAMSKQGSAPGLK